MFVTTISTRRMRRYGLLLLPIALLFLNARLVQAQGPDVASTNRPAGEWNRYRLKDGEFSVLLPAPPALSSYEGGGRLGPQEDRLRHLIGTYYQGCGYVISVYETRKSLDDFSNWFLSTRSNAEFRRNIKAAGMSGKEFAYADASAKGITQVLVSKERTYVFKAEASSLGNPDIDFPKFFESITFGRPVVGNVISEGPSSVQSIYSPSVTKELDPTFTARDVTQRARVLSKPEPSYTEEARQAQITGTVVLRVVFSDAGEVIKIRAVSGLPHGLTEKAVGAARQIKFIPAIKDGQFVSTHIQLEYNFNLY